MKNYSYHILRVGTAITFLWIGVLILKDPISWAGYMQSWAEKILPLSPGSAMITVAFLDIFIGVLFLTDYKTWIGGILAALHLSVIIAVAGINAITVRDIGLLASAVALFASSFPASKYNFLKKL